MVIYIITKCGRTLKDEAIQYLLERIALSENKSSCKYIYRCPDINCDHNLLLNELERTPHKYMILFYETMEKWFILNEADQRDFVKCLGDYSWNGIPLNEMISELI